MYTWTVVEICLVISFPLLVYWFYWRWTHRRMLELAKFVPGPPSLPLVGNTFLFIANPGEQLNKIEKLMNTYGQYVKMWIGADLNICVKNPADIRLLLKSNKLNRKGPLYNFMKPFIGEGVLSGGATWRNYRKIVTPSYNKKSIRIFSEVFNREAIDLARVLTSKDPNTTFNVYFDTLQCTTQIVCQTLMGLSKEDSLNIKRLDEVILKTQGMYNLIYSKMTRWWLQVPFIYYLTGGATFERHFKKIMDEMTSDILAKRQRALKTDEVNEDGMSIVDRYILDGGLSDSEIKKQMFALFTTVSKLTLPVGTSLMIPIHHLHRDPQYWDEPHKVKPERFLPENVKKRDPGAFIPFSLGIMDYLGRVYAKSLIKTLVVKVVREVHFEADGNLEDLELHVAVSVKFAKGYNLRARLRKPFNMFRK